MLLEVVGNYTREASNTVKFKMFKVKVSQLGLLLRNFNSLLTISHSYDMKMSLKSEKSNKIEHRNLYMLHRLDIQRLSGKKQSK